MQGHIPSLPVEILDLIVSFVDSKFVQRSIALTSKQFHTLVLPRIYRNIHLVEQDSDYDRELWSFDSLARWDCRDETEQDDVENRCRSLSEPQRKTTVEAAQSLWLYEQKQQRAEADAESGLRFPQLRNLTLLLLRKPQYARYVQHFAVTNIEDMEYDFRDRLSRQKAKRVTPVPPEMAERIKIWTRVEKDKVEWEESIEDEREHDGLLAILITTLVNVCSIDIGLPFLAGGSFSWRMLMRMSNALTMGVDVPGLPLSKIAGLSVIYPGVERANRGNTQLLGHLLLLPTLQRLFVGNLRTDDMENDWKRTLATLTPRSSNVNHIELRDCGLEEGLLLYNVLRMPRALKSLVLTFDTYSTLDKVTLRTIISQYAESLESLALDIGNALDIDEFYDESDEYLLVESLAECHALKRLRISGPFLFNGEPLREGKRDPIDPYDCLVQIRKKGVKEKGAHNRHLEKSLPPNLEQLHVKHLVGNLLARTWLALTQILKNRKAQAPNLRKIIFEDDWTLDRKMPSSAKLLVRIAAEAGVEVVLVNDNNRNKLLGHTSKAEPGDFGWSMDETGFWQYAARTLSIARDPDEMSLSDSESDSESDSASGYSESSSEMILGNAYVLESADDNGSVSPYRAD